MEDFFYKFLKIYHRLPLGIKVSIGKLYSLLPLRIRYGRSYIDYQNRIRHFATLNAKETDEEHERLLLKSVNIAIEKLPFYKDYQPCKTIYDLQKLPIVDKKIISNNRKALLNPELSSSGLLANTGGSSGTPFEFFLHKYITRSKEKAHFHWFFGLFGYKFNDKMVVIRGKPLRGGANYEYSPIDNQLFISCYNINDESITDVARAIERFKPKFIHGYPSSIKILVELLLKNNIQLKISVVSIFTGSELLTTEDKALFTTYFGVRVVNFYGHSECLIHGGYSTQDDLFHFAPFYGHIELVDDDDNQITTLGTIGRIVATGFDNGVMPFVRYDTGDLGILGDSCDFRGGVTLQSIYGRGGDYILLNDKTKVSLTAFIFGQHFPEFNQIIQMQIIQNKVGVIKILIVRQKEFNNSTAKSLINRLSRSVDSKLTIELEYVQSIETTARGKHRFLIQSLQ